MIKIYNTDLQTNKTESIDKIQKGCWINIVAPTEEEIKMVCQEVNLDEAFIRYPLDYEEQARIDQEDDAVLFVIDVKVFITPFKLFEIIEAYASIVPFKILLYI